MVPLPEPEHKKKSAPFSLLIPANTKHFVCTGIQLLFQEAATVHVQIKPLKTRLDTTVQ